MIIPAVMLSYQFMLVLPMKIIARGREVNISKERNDFPLEVASLNLKAHGKREKAVFRLGLDILRQAMNGCAGELRASAVRRTRCFVPRHICQR
jgi:hypothetical protein